jgi:hypothetical protein
MPGVSDPSFVEELFGDILPIAEVLEIESSRYLTFEYIGAIDHLGETWPGQPRTRGSMATSTDAAVRYRTPQGVTEVALIEWKYTEAYGKSELNPSKQPGFREDRYRARWEDNGCPVRRDLVPYEDLFVEPFYQLLRQQLLARAMEESHELGAEKVRVLHLCPEANGGVHRAVSRPSHHAVGNDPLEIWSQMCVDPGRFIRKDPGFIVLLRSAEYASRYPPLEPTGPA